MDGHPTAWSFILCNILHTKELEALAWCMILHITGLSMARNLQEKERKTNAMDQRLRSEEEAINASAGGVRLNMNKASKEVRPHKRSMLKERVGATAFGRCPERLSFPWGTGPRQGAALG
jgi:hypothetical protein